MSARKCVVLVGTTGNGKSTTGNTLAGRDCFSASDGFESQTRHCFVEDYEYAGEAWRVVDTIGLSDTEIASEEVLNRFSSFSDQAPDGVDAFLYVVRLGRFENEHHRALQAFVTNCGEDVLKRTILVFTHCPYSVGEMQQRLEQQQNHKLQKWFKRVQTWVGIENHKNPEKARAALQESLGMVCKNSKGAKYMNKALKEARARRNELTVRMKPLRQELKKQGERVLRDLCDGACNFEGAASEINDLLEREKSMQKKEMELEEARRQAQEASQRAAEAEQDSKRVREEGMGFLLEGLTGKGNDRRITDKVINKHREELNEVIRQLCEDGRLAAREAIRSQVAKPDSGEIEYLQKIEDTVAQERAQVQQLFSRLQEGFESATAEVEAFKGRVKDVRQQNENDIAWIKEQERSADEQLTELLNNTLTSKAKKRRL
jgi:hypothetical protein